LDFDVFHVVILGGVAAENDKFSQSPQFGRLAATIGYEALCF
jgi:hypothetical protein